MSELDKTIGELLTEVKYLRADFNSHENYVSEKVDTIIKDIEELKIWRSGFVAKFSTYAAIALFLGSFIAQIGASILSERL